MNRNESKITCWVFLTALGMLLQCCATVPDNIQLERPQEVFSAIPTLHVVRHPIEALQKHSGFALLGGLGSIAIANDQGENMVKSYGLPDYGVLVEQRFLELAQKELPGWPKMQVAKEPLQGDYSGALPVMELTPNTVIFRSFGRDPGFWSRFTARIRDTQGRVIWQCFYEYGSARFGRITDMEVLEAENGKLLKQEMEFAAQQTALALVQHLQGKQP